MKTLRSPCAPVRGPAKPWMAGLCTTLSAAHLFACRKMRSRAEGILADLSVDTAIARPARVFEGGRSAITHGA